MSVKKWKVLVTTSATSFWTSSSIFEVVSSDDLPSQTKNTGYDPVSPDGVVLPSESILHPTNLK